jgi:hypothetical protein
MPKQWNPKQKSEKFIKNKKLDSFFEFHIKLRKHQNHEMHLLALILGFGCWNFAGDVKMNQFIAFLLLKLDLKEKVKFSHTLLYISPFRSQTSISIVCPSKIGVCFFFKFCFYKFVCNVGFKKIFLCVSTIAVTLSYILDQLSKF